VIAYFVIDFFWLSERHGSKIFKAIKNQRLYYAPTVNGSVLLDADNLTTDLYLRDILTKSKGVEPSVESIIDNKSLVYEIPPSIRSTKLLSRSNYKDSLQSFPGQVFTMMNLKYRVTTATQDYISTLLFIKTSEGFKLAAMYSQPG